MSRHLAIFDFDGTIATGGVVPQEILDGFKHLREIGYTTTISTGRGYSRIRDGLGDVFTEIVSPDAALILEHGSQITDRDGNVLFMADFSVQEIEHIIDFIRSNIGIFRLAWYTLPDPSSRDQVWCMDPAELDDELSYRSHYADIFTGTIGQLRERLLAQPISNVTMKLKRHVIVENLKLHFTRTETDVIFQDGNMEFIKNSANKALAIGYVLDKAGLTKDDLLVAGNAINDVEMLDVGAARQLFVGDEATFNNILPYMSEPTKLQRVDTPAALGDFLSSLDD